MRYFFFFIFIFFLFYYFLLFYFSLHFRNTFLQMPETSPETLDLSLPRHIQEDNTIICNFISAINNKDETRAELLVKKHPDFDINMLIETSPTTFTRLLHFACHRHAASVVKVLLAHPLIEPNSRMGSYRHPLHVAIVSMNVVEVLLADPRIDVNARDINEATPFWMACHNNDMRIVDLIFKSRGPQVNAKVKAYCIQDTLLGRNLTLATLKKKRFVAGEYAAVRLTAHELMLLRQENGFSTDRKIVNILNFYEKPDWTISHFSITAFGNDKK